MARDGGRLGVRRADPDARLSIVEHLTELRSRIAISVVVLVAAFAALYAFNGRLLAILLDPLAPEYRSLLALSPTEPFFVTLKVVLGAAILVTLPVLLYQLYAYVVPAIGTQTRRKMLVVVGGVSLLFIGGVVFVYFLVLPVALQWLLGFAGSDFTVASSTASIRSVRSSVLVPGVFCTLTTTAGMPRSAPVPRFGDGPRRTSATSPIVIGAMVSANVSDS
jgi:sec-independent protein translocase protein TatC